MSDALNTLPWICCLLVALGAGLLVWRSLSIVHDLAKLALQLGQGMAPTVPAMPAAAVPSTLPAPKPAPAPEAAKPTGPFAGYPAWFTQGLHDLGFHETGDNQGIEQFIAQAHTGALGQPWCMIWANAKLEQVGIPGTRSPSSQSPRTHPDFVQLSGPAPGAIVVFWRISKTSGQGHVGFYRGEDATRIWTLGGNENDMVQIEALPKDSATFGLIGYWWPKSVPLPTVGPVLMPTGSPTSIQTPPTAVPAAPNGKQTNIIATVFGGQQSAYGGPIHDDQPGVALPFRFSGERPRVRVTNANTGAAVDCDIVDVGPWNTKDPYWQTGTRPQAETGTDTTGRKTNGAGIDLTAAAASAIGIDGKGRVNWEFLQPTTTEPKVT